MTIFLRAGLLVGVFFLSACGGDTAPQASGTSAEPIIVYTSRNEQLIKPLFDAYTQETGQPIQYLTGKAGALLQRLRSEGAGSPADLFMTVDAGNLWKAADDGLLQPAGSDTLMRNIAANLQDPDGRWFGLSVRARTIVYSTARIDPSQLSTYAGLADPQWQGRLCLRTAKKVYNQSLVAMMIAADGAEQARQVVRGWVANLAAEPFSNDTAVMQAILAGQCDVGIVNTYYFGRLQKDDPALPLALYWPNQAETLGAARGVHVNISGAGVTQSADQKAAAVKLMEWLSAGSAQRLYAGENLEYPANPSIKPVPQVQAWGAFVPNLINVAKAGELQADAVKLMEREGYQ